MTGHLVKTYVFLVKSLLAVKTLIEISPNRVSKLIHHFYWRKGLFFFTVKELIFIQKHQYHLCVPEWLLYIHHLKECYPYLCQT